MPKQWYAMRSKANKEQFLFEQLNARGMHTYLPLIRSHAINPRARKMKPYFPGYLFIELDVEHEDSSDLQWVPGGVGLVSFGDEYPAVPPNFISALQKHLDELNQRGGKFADEYKPGDELQIQEGPLKGYQALFDARIRGTDRVRVLLKLLRGQLVRVELPSSEVKKTQG